MDFQKTWKKIIAKEESEEKRIHMRDILPSQKVGRVIGKNGYNLKDLAEKYNIFTTISRKSEDGGQLVHVEGPAFEMKIVWKRILSLAFNDIEFWVTSFIIIIKMLLTTYNRWEVKMQESIFYSARNR
jgi:hypothetical protein